MPRPRYDDGPAGVLSSSIMDNVLVLRPAGDGNTRCDTYWSWTTVDSGSPVLRLSDV